MLTVSVTFSYGQGLTLRSITKVVDIPLQKYLVVHHHPDGQGEELTKEHAYLFGTLELVTKDSITLLVDELEREIRVEGEYKTELTKEYQVFEKYTVAKTKIFGLTILKSAKTKNRQRLFRNTGGVFVLTGLATLANTAIVGGKGRTTLVTSAGVQIGVGALLLVLAKRKHYIFKSQNGLPEWRLN